MAGTFSKSTPPVRPGTYFKFVGTPQPTILPSTTGIVALTIEHDWGPANQVVSYDSFQEWLADFGTTVDDGYRAVYGAFQGEGLSGSAGAARVLVYRMVPASAVKASKVLQNTAPAAAITLTAKYFGVLGNTMTASVIANTRDATLNDLIIFVGGAEVERFEHVKTDITALGAAINASSRYVVASSITSGTALAIVDPATAFTGATAPASTGTEWSASFAQLGGTRFGMYAPHNLTDPTITASLKVWVQQMNTSGKRFMAVVGGAAGETISTAKTRQATLNDPNIMTVGVGTVTDATFGDQSTAQLAPRIAGLLARVGERESITFKRLQGLTLKIAASDNDIISALGSGIVVLGQDSNPDAPVRVERGLTTWTTTTDPDRPQAIFKNPKYVITMHGIEREITEWSDTNVIGRLPVNDNTREYLVSAVSFRMRQRETDFIVQPDWTVTIDPDPPASDAQEFIALLYGVKFVRELAQVWNTVRVG